MRNREYMFTNRHYTRGGIIAMILGILSVLCFAAGILESFKNKGNGGSVVGLLGAGALLFSVVGAIIGIRSFKEEERFYTFSWIGSGICCIMAIFMIVITVMGRIV